MPEQPLSAVVWDALRQLAYSDGVRAGMLSALAHARELAAHDRGLESARAAAEAAGGRLRLAAARRRELEAAMEDARLRVQRAEARLSSDRLQHQREVEAVQHEIASLQLSIAQDEQAWLEVSAEEEASQDPLAEAEAALEAETPLARARSERAMEELHGAKERLADLDARRRLAAQKLPPDVRERYRQLYPKTGGRPFAEASAGECSHCRMGVSAEAMQMLRARLGVPSCPTCGRLLLAT
jgi:predicted  nucleic acid-binding Zn-ribbon protein